MRLLINLVTANHGITSFNFHSVRVCHFIYAYHFLTSLFPPIYAVSHESLFQRFVVLSHLHHYACACDIARADHVNRACRYAWKCKFAGLSLIFSCQFASACHYAPAWRYAYACRFDCTGLCKAYRIWKAFWRAGFCMQISPCMSVCPRMSICHCMSVCLLLFVPVNLPVQVRLPAFVSAFKFARACQIACSCLWFKFSRACQIACSCLCM